MQVCAEAADLPLVDVIHVIEWQLWKELVTFQLLFRLLLQSTHQREVRDGHLGFAHKITKNTHTHPSFICTLIHIKKDTARNRQAKTDRFKQTDTKERYTQKQRQRQSETDRQKDRFELSSDRQTVRASETHRQTDGTTDRQGI